MPTLPFPVRLGSRPLLALTCTGCGRLQPAGAYEWRPRRVGGVAYVDRRCRSCRWARMEHNPGR